MVEAGAKARLGAWVWVLVVAAAVFELAGQWVLVARVPTAKSWRDAAAFVRSGFEPGDRIIAAPPWADPIMRAELGDLLTLHTASVNDDAGIARVWAIGASDAPVRPGEPAIDERFGRVRVRMWPVHGDAVLCDLVEAVDAAAVDYVIDGTAQPCVWTERPAWGGGLGHGPLPPAGRHVCDPRHPWLWVGATVMADLDLEPRRCVWQHPTGAEPVRTTFHDVPLGDVLVVEGGLDYNNARTKGDSPVLLRVLVDDREVAEMQVGDREPWTRLEIDTGERAGDTATVRIETTTERPHARTFCWSASSRRTSEVR